MPYPQLASVHLAAVLAAFPLGSYLLLRPKGSAHHRRLGRVYAGLMVLTAAISLALPARIGPRWLGHFGWLHVLSLLVLIAIPRAVLAARRGNLRVHRRNMVGVYLGGFWIAGGFALAPGRLLHEWLFK